MQARAGELPPERTRPIIPDWPVPPGGGRVDPSPALPLVVEPLGMSLDDALLARRVVLVAGSLDPQRATEAAARLLHLDAVAEGDITVRLDCGEADVRAALMLVDTFESLRAKVHVVVVGQAVGAAVIVVAAADTASMYPHARIVLTEPDLPRIEGDASALEPHLAEQQRLVRAAYDVIARRCGRSADEIEHDARQRKLLTAADAVDYGVVTTLG